MEEDWIVVTRLFAKYLASFIIRVVDGVGLWNDFGGIPLDRCFFLFGLSSTNDDEEHAVLFLLLLLFNSLFESEESLHDLDEALINESSAESYILLF